jgi:4-amino-4-deoxy-L-arabinose transferase-like glycosyltransferase
LAAFSFGRRAGGWALALAAVFPPLIVIGNALTPEALFVPLVLAAMAATLHARSQPGWRWPALAGGLCGLALLTRVNVAPVVPLLALAIWGEPPRLSLRAAARPATLILATALVAVPWTVRNLVELDKLVPISTQHGYTLAGTYNPGSDGDRKYPAAWRVPIVEAERIRAEKGALGEVELGEELGAEARRYVRDRPAYPLKVAFWNSVRLLHLDGLDYARGDNFHIGVDRWLSDAGAIGLWLLLPLAAAGGLMARGSSPHWLFWAVPAALAVTIFVAGEIRFRTPIDPFLLMLGGVALAGLSRVRPSAAG